MVRRQTDTLAKVLERPTRADVRWADIESLLRGLGAELSEGRGSRVRVVLKGVRAVFHRPHPRPTADKGTVESVRKFLANAGVTG